jgi:polyferredoxin
MKPLSDAALLRIVKFAHTVAWAFFAGSTLAIPVCAALHRYEAALLFIGIVFVEGLILVVNGWRCPLTDIAARYTDDRCDNFDIYLPEWLARHNKTIFTILYLLGIIFTVALWQDWLPVSHSPQ